MRKARNSFVYLYLIILFSGCNTIFNIKFDLFELGHFNPNGSGKLELIFSMNGARGAVALAEQMIPEHVEVVRLILSEARAEMAKRLKIIPGISKVAYGYDPHPLHYELSFYFNSIATLNKAMAQINNEDPLGMTYFQLDEHKFVRTYVSNKVGKLLEIYKQNDDSKTESFDLDFFFNKMNYIAQYAFKPEIQKVSNPLATIHQNHKIVTIMDNMFHHINDKVTPITLNQDELTTIEVTFKPFKPVQPAKKSPVSKK